MSPSAGYKIVQLANGTHSVHSFAESETFHPVIGPVAEAEALYVHQLRLRDRLAAHTGDFVVWDVGLGAAANALTVLRCTQDIPGHIHLISFDHLEAPLRFAHQHAADLGYFGGYEQAVDELLGQRQTRFKNGSNTVQWDWQLGDFPTWVATPEARTFPKPHAILFDAFSPAKNPAMWTLPLFSQLFALLDPARPCALPTYSRSTMLRVTLLRAGFFVGVGHATGEKEETTIAANSLDLISEPLDQKWLERARNSTSAEPLSAPIYRQARWSPETRIALTGHPQFLSKVHL